MDPKRIERARSFGGVADAYERARPGYPEAALAFLAGEPPARVVDVGAGTGKLTRQLAAAGYDVVAVEPSARMLKRLRAAAPGVPARIGAAEDIPLPDACADAVVAAQAFHWFDADKALPEIARVLKPGGRLGLIWNMRDDSVAWVRKLSKLVGAERLDHGEPVEPIERSGLFGPVETAEFAYEHTVDREGLLDLVRSRSYVATLPPDENARVLEAVGRLYDETASADGLVLPYVTTCFTARKP